MALRELEKINTSMVLLSATEKSIQLSTRDLAEIIRDPSPPAVSQDATGQANGVQITSLRDQIVVTILGGKLQFEDKSDDMPLRGLLPDVVNGFLDLLRKQGIDRFRAYGFNFDIAFDATGDQAASEILADRYIDTEALSRKGQIDVRGAGLRLYFSHAEAQCDMKIEPRQGKVDAPRFYAHINYNFELEDQTMPPLDVFKTKYQGLWPQYTELVEALFVRP